MRKPVTPPVSVRVRLEHMSCLCGSTCARVKATRLCETCSCHVEAVPLHLSACLCLSVRATARRKAHSGQTVTHHFTLSPHLPLDHYHLPPSPPPTTHHHTHLTYPLTCMLVHTQNEWRAKQGLALKTRDDFEADVRCALCAHASPARERMQHVRA
jgi:hypothetical protein